MMLKSLGRLFFVAFSVFLIFYAFANAKDNPVKDRATAIDLATKLYPGYIKENFKIEFDNTDTFIKLTKAGIFQNSGVWKIKAGYILYTPMNGIVFVIIKNSKSENRLVALAPSQLNNITGNSLLSPGEPLLDAVLVKIPKALVDFYQRVFELDPGQLAQIFGPPEVAAATYKKETLSFLISPYLRASQYSDCLKQIETEVLNKRIKTDLLNAGLKDEAKRGFDYIDIIPVSDKWAMLLQADKGSGTYFAISAVNMTGKCMVTETQYKSF